MVKNSFVASFDDVEAGLSVETRQTGTSTSRTPTMVGPTQRCGARPGLNFKCGLLHAQSVARMGGRDIKAAASASGKNESSLARRSALVRQVYVPVLLCLQGMGNCNAYGSFACHQNDEFGLQKILFYTEKLVFKMEGSGIQVPETTTSTSNGLVSYARSSTVSMFLQMESSDARGFVP